MAKKRKTPTRKPAAKRRKSATAPTTSVKPPSKRGDDLLSGAEAARIMGIHKGSLERIRGKKNGPPFTKDSSGRIWYKRRDIDSHLGPDTAADYALFSEASSSKLPPPEPVKDGVLTPHNLGICEAMARAAADLDEILKYLSITRSALDTDVLEGLTKDVDKWQVETRHGLRHSAISSALRDKGQVAYIQLAEKLFQDQDDPEGWSSITENTAERITALIEKHKKRARERASV